MANNNNQTKIRTEAEVEKFLADLKEDQQDRQELEDDDNLKNTDRAPSSAND